MVAEGQQREVPSCQLGTRAAELCSEGRIRAGGFCHLRKTSGSHSVLSSKQGGRSLLKQLSLEKSNTQGCADYMLHWAATDRKPC